MKCKAFLLLFGFNLIFVFAGLNCQISNAQPKPLTYPEIITALNTKLPNTVFKNKTQLINWLITQIQQRKVEKPLTTDREDDLRQSGATDELLEAIRENSPSLPKTTPANQDNSNMNDNSQAISLANQALAEAARVNFVVAKELASSALKLNNNLALALAISAWAKYPDDNQTARMELEKAVQLEPTNPLFRIRLAFVYEVLNEKELADKNVNQVLGQLNSPKTDVEYYVRGLANSYLQKMDEAIADYTKAIVANPNFAVAYHNRAGVFSIKEEYDLAIADYTKVIEINPKFPISYFNRGLAYYKKQQYDLAISDYSKVMELNPQNPSAYINRGNSYSEKKQYNLAITDYNKAIEIAPKFALAYTNRANAYDKIGRADLAAADRKKAQELSPK